ncbi:MAG: phosphoribosylanthranilate isomerase [Acidobacteria bacterium]|nr:phosphoribosylanthranilate isomerase [Acidobacteriota bacterium]
MKICCISTAQEAEIAVAAGASALGLVSAMPSGPGVISEEDIAAIASKVPPVVASFLLTSELEAEPILKQHTRCRTSTLQLVDAVRPGVHAILRRVLPGIRIVQVIHVTGPESVDEAIALAPDVDAILLDSGNPGLATKELGGTGRTHDWTVSRAIRDAIDPPLFLAGGLDASNVEEAINAVRPFGVDICSGVRTDGSLDPSKLDDFIAAVGRADR